MYSRYCNAISCKRCCPCFVSSTTIVFQCMDARYSTYDTYQTLATILPLAECNAATSGGVQCSAVQCWQLLLHIFYSICWVNESSNNKPSAINNRIVTLSSSSRAARSLPFACCLQGNQQQNCEKACMYASITWMLLVVFHSTKSKRLP